MEIMTKKQIDIAIAKGKLPFSLLDYLLFVIAIYYAFYFIIEFIHSDPNSYSRTSLLYVAPVLVVFIIWSVLWILKSKELIQYPSNINLERKGEILKNLFADYKVLYTSKKDNYYYLIIKTGLLDIHGIRILFNESSYYINSAQYMRTFMYKDVSLEIIDKIKEFETEYSESLNAKDKNNKD